MRIDDLFYLLSGAPPNREVHEGALVRCMALAGGLASPVSRRGACGVNLCSTVTTLVTRSARCTLLEASLNRLL